jgi:MFS family permease
MRSLADAIYALALTLWIGGLWVVGLIVAPTLFHALSDRFVAGRCCGQDLYADCLRRNWLRYLHDDFPDGAFWRAIFRQGAFWLLILLLMLTLAGEFGVQPILASLKGQSLSKGVVEERLPRSLRRLAWRRQCALPD